MESHNLFNNNYHNFQNNSIRNQEIKKSPFNSILYTMNSTNISTKFSTDENNNNNYNKNTFNSNDNEQINNYNNNSRNNFNSLFNSESNFNNPTENYINNLKAKFEIEKEKLINEHNEYKKNNENEKIKMQDKIIYLENRIKDIQDKNNLDNKSILDQFNFNLKTIIREKDEEIQKLKNRNNELNQCNNKLISELTKNLDLLNETRLNLENKVIFLERQNNQYKKEKESLKDYYNNKLEYHIKNLEDDKKKIINGFQNEISELKTNFENSKESFNKIINERNDDITRLTDNSKNDLDRLSNLNNNFKKEIDKLNEERVNLLKENKEQKLTIENLQNNLNHFKNETERINQLNKMLEEKCDQLNRQNSNLKTSNQTLNRMTYGKFKRLHTFQ